MPECAHRHLLSSAVINWPIKCLAFVERKWIFQDACGTKNSFFVFRKQRMDSGNGEISMNRIKGTFLFLIRLKGWNPRVKFWSFEVLAQNFQKVGLEVVKCDEHSNLFSICDAVICTRSSKLPYRSRHGAELLDLSLWTELTTPQKIYVTTSQYETNLSSTHVNI